MRVATQALPDCSAEQSAIPSLNLQAWYIEPVRRRNAKLRFEAEQKLIRYEHVIKLQMAEITKLRAENKRLLDWILGTNDALTCLQGIYQNPESSEYSKIKAATGLCHSNDPSYRWQFQFVVLMSRANAWMQRRR